MSHSPQMKVLWCRARPFKWRMYIMIVYVRGEVINVNLLWKKIIFFVCFVSVFLFSSIFRVSIIIFNCVHIMQLAWLILETHPPVHKCIFNVRSMKLIIHFARRVPFIILRLALIPFRTTLNGAKWNETTKEASAAITTTTMTTKKAAAAAPTMGRKLSWICFIVGPRTFHFAAYTVTNRWMTELSSTIAEYY